MVFQPCLPPGILYWGIGKVPYLVPISVLWTKANYELGNTDTECLAFKMPIGETNDRISFEMCCCWNQYQEIRMGHKFVKLSKGV